MKILFNQSKITILISVILLATINVGSSNKTSDKVAVIFSGHEFHHEGVKLREALLEKNYDVHLTEVRPKYNFTKFDIPDWSKTQLAKDLDGHYKQLLFIVTGHGNEEIGANIRWDSLLNLVKLFEQKADEIFIHLETCFSGDAAERWLPQLGNNVKVLTTSSCKSATTSFNPYLTDWDIVNQIFTGYYLETKWLDRESNAHKDVFEKLNCNSNVSELEKLIHTPCKRKQNANGHNTCTKLHIWKGKDEKLTDWNILPINLTVENNQKILGGNYEPTYLEFPDKQCKLPQIIFSRKEERVDFNPAIPMIFSNNYNDSLVNTRDPIKTWKLRTYNIPIRDKEDFKYYYSQVPKQFKEKNIKPYSTILAINESSCTINEVNKQCGTNDLKKVESMILGYYNTRKIWILDDNSGYNVPEPEGFEYVPADYTITIIICIISAIVVLIIVGCFIAHCCTGKKKHQSVDQFRSNAPVEINTPQPHPYPTRVSNRTEI
jgi:hypothetical protein